MQNGKPGLYKGVKMSEELKRIAISIERIEAGQRKINTRLDTMDAQLFTHNNIPGLIDRAMKNDENILSQQQMTDKKLDEFLLTRKETCPAIKILNARKSDGRVRRWRKQDIVIGAIAIGLSTLLSAMSLILSIGGKP
jgi:hypothetical protein